jgi:xylulokinase
MYRHQPNVYEKTERIQLISSFIPTLLTGQYVDIDLSDGSGMNLLDIKTHKWNEHLLEITAPNLKVKLGDPIKSDTSVGFINSYWCRKYGFSSDCVVFAFSGDNPCSLLGLNLNKPGDIAISIGTSDVLFAVTNDPKPNCKEGSILIHPQNSESFMIMLVYKNGDTSRKYVNNSVHKDSDWNTFSKSIANTPIAFENRINFYYIETEITPALLNHNTGIIKFNQFDELIDNEIKFDEYECRAIIESQVLSYKYHSNLLGLKNINKIIVTGGGSLNKEILQIIADIFECECSASYIPNTAAAGASLKALNCYYKLNNIDISLDINSNLTEKIIKPNVANFQVYRNLFKRYSKLESIAVEKLSKFN